MRFIKPILIGFAGLFIVITLISLLMPSRISLVRSVMIQADIESVKQQLSDLENWKNWYPLLKNDSSGKVVSADEIISGRPGQQFMVRRVSDTPGMLHFVVLSSGHPEIHYRFLLNQPKGKESVEVHWQVQSRLRWYPWEKFSGMFFSETSGPGYEQALQSLKEFCEKK